jgi:putative DNA primase/helicase
VLAWLVKGAVRWYQDGRVMPTHPAAVVVATAAWRGSVDLLLRYIEESLVPDGESHVWNKELYREFDNWLKANGHVPWSDQNFTARFGQHPWVQDNGVAKKDRVRRKDTAGENSKGISRPRAFPQFLANPKANPGPGPLPKQYTAWLGVRFRGDEDD